MGNPNAAQQRHQHQGDAPKFGLIRDISGFNAHAQEWRGAYSARTMQSSLRGMGSKYIMGRRVRCAKAWHGEPYIADFLRTVLAWRAHIPFVSASRLPAEPPSRRPTIERATTIWLGSKDCSRRQGPSSRRSRYIVIVINKTGDEPRKQDTQANEVFIVHKWKYIIHLTLRKKWPEERFM